MVLQDSGEILAAGAFEQINGEPRKGIAQLSHDGSLDLNVDFGSGVNGLDFPVVYTATAYADSCLLLGGAFTTFDGATISNFALVPPLADPPSQPPYAALAEGADSAVNSLLEQSDGSVLLGGEFTRLDLYPRQGLARLLPVTYCLDCLRIERQAGTPVLHWPGDARFQRASSISGPWEDVPGAKSPYTPASGDPHAFFRLVH